MRKFFLFVFFFPSLIGVIFGFSIVNLLEIPDIRELETFKPKAETRLYADDGTVFASLFLEKRIPISIKDVPDHLKKAFIAIEDVRFYKHSGIDIRGIARATIKNLLKGGFVEGGSTITQQLARNLFLSQKKTLKRKIEEMVLAIQIEKAYSKEEILNHYLNLVYLGEGIYGVEAAARKYFDKNAKDLTLEESATLAGLTRAPTAFSPFKAPLKALERRNLVLKKMYEAGFIKKDEYLTAIKRPLKLAPFKVMENKAGYFIDYVKESIGEEIGQDIDILGGGYHISTTLSLEMTNYAIEAIEKGLKSYRMRHPEKKDLPEVALIAIEVKTGEIKVLIGGKNFKLSPFNRAVHAKRQPGSAFKPFVFMAALESGFKPSEILLDSPIKFIDPWGRMWEPKNYRDEYFGPVTMETALALSLNCATIRLLEKVGVENVVNLVKRMHIRGEFEPFLSLALGTKEVYVLDLASAYLVFANGGIFKKPYVIKSVITNDGDEIFNIEREERKEERILDEEKVSLLVQMMKKVIKNGTAKAASSLPYFLAGKTGTTDDFRDAWFIGFSPYLLCAVWIGYDRDSTLGKNESGAVAALPIWIDFMSKALRKYPNEDFPFLGKESP